MGDINSWEEAQCKLEVFEQILEAKSLLKSASTTGNLNFDRNFRELALKNLREISEFVQILQKTLQEKQMGSTNDSQKIIG